MSHYATLGVAPDATPEEIKLAWRRRCSEKHPDKGGTEEEQKAVNQAYAVLSDPERKRVYDETGSDGQRPDPDAEARELLIALFTKGLERVEGDLVQFVETQIQGAIDEGQRRIDGSRRTIERMTRKRSTVKVKAGQNLVHDIIDAKINRAEIEIAALAKAIADARRALVLLADFEYVGEPVTPDVRVSEWRFDQLMSDGFPGSSFKRG
jgi:curved DNA-binding protein CbpA